MIFFCRTFWFLSLALLICCAHAGTVTTRDGKGYTGLVQFVDAEHLSVGTGKGPQSKIALTNVLMATFDAPIDPAIFSKGAPLAGKGSGVLAAYHDRPNFKGRVIYRIDETIDHQWRSKQPVFDLPRDYFSVRWTAELEPPVTGVYTFTLHANDGGKLKVGDFEMGKWEALSGFRKQAKVALEGGKRVPFVFEFFDNYGEASARVLWKGPGFQEAPIPTSQLYPTTDKAPKGLKGTTGLLGCYYQNRFFYGDGVLAVDAMMDFSPVTPPAEFPDKNYSVRWTGQLVPPHTEECTFKITTDEGVRLWVGGSLVINELSNRSARAFTGTAPLERDVRYNIRLESVHRAGEGNLKVTWMSKSKQESVLGGQGVYPHFTPSVPEESGGDEVGESQTLGVFSWGGSRIAAGVASADDSVVRFVEGTLPSRISTVNVARIVLKPVQAKWRKVLHDNRKGVLLRSGDFIEGELKSLKEDWLVLNSVLFGVKVYGLDEVVALVLDKVADKPARDSRFELVLESGSLLHVRSFKMDKGGVIVDDPTVGKFLVPLAQLDEMRCIKLN
jgi:hypothetical protein